VVGATIKTMNKKAADFEIINVGSGKPITIQKVAEQLIKLSGKDLKPEITYVFRKGDIRHCFANISKARQLLGWEPKVSFEEGVKKMYQWAKDQESEDTFEEAFQEMIKKGLTTKGHK
jgi:dTDP-L-rhamnose 4-epimerase